VTAFALLLLLFGVLLLHAAISGKSLQELIQGFGNISPESTPGSGSE
jgi:hypothetical protein